MTVESFPELAARLSDQFHDGLLRDAQMPLALISFDAGGRLMLYVNGLFIRNDQDWENLHVTLARLAEELKGVRTKQIEEGYDKLERR